MSTILIADIALLALLIACWGIALYFHVKYDRRYPSTQQTMLLAEQLKKYERACHGEATVCSQAFESADMIRARHDIVNILKRAERKRQKIMAKAQAEHHIRRAEADEQLQKAEFRSTEIILRARKRAEKIAEKTFCSAENWQQYQDDVTAIRNIIRTYSDDATSFDTCLLDNLAEDYCHVEAGRDLRNAINATSTLKLSGKAGYCSHADKAFRYQAIRFVVDVFDRKVNVILSGVRENNGDELHQAIVDAFHQANDRGQAFRHARIADDYFRARINELKCAVTLMTFRQREREEQHSLKEQVRQEEKTRHDLEKATRDAKKQALVLTTTMGDIRHQLKTANDEQRAVYEAYLTELTVRLEKIRAHGQRAASMAQQTRCGYVYVISNVGSFGEGVFKIGMTRRLEPLDRIRELSDASVPFSFDIHAIIYSEDAPALEHKLHRRFADYQVNRINHRKEFFSVPLKKIRQAIEESGVEAHWTMTAGAWEYRKSLAMLEPRLEAVS